MLFCYLNPFYPMADFESNIKIICLEDPALMKLINEVYEKFKKEHLGDLDPWLNTEEAMSLLKISSNTTLQKLKDEGKIDYRKRGKNNLYRRTSILEYLENLNK